MRNEMIFVQMSVSVSAVAGLGGYNKRWGLSQKEYYFMYLFHIVL